MCLAASGSIDHKKAMVSGKIVSSKVFEDSQKIMTPKEVIEDIRVLYGQEKGIRDHIAAHAGALRSSKMKDKIIKNTTTESVEPSRILYEC